MTVSIDLCKRRISWRLAWAVFALLMGLLVTARVTAKEARDFAGTYYVSQTTRQGEAYSLVFKARVSNFSHANVAGGQLILRASDGRGSVYAVFPGVSISDHKQAAISTTVTVPRHEYELWQRGAPPRLYIQFKDSAGNTRERRVELLRRAIK